jgi:hypothetical protein
MAGVGVGGVVLALSARSAPVRATRPPEERIEVVGKGVPQTFAKVAPAAAGPEAALKGEAARTGKGQRIEDLPPATPVAYRPLRVEELPQAPPAERSRRAKGATAAQPLRIEDLPSISDAVRPLRPDELTPELVQRADDLLWNHPAPLGVDVPFEVNGKNYIARFALHYHEFGSEKKPWGYHKGVTIYSTWE